MGTIVLDENESAHAVRVCRASEGDVLQLSDGLGHFAEAQITKADAKACQVEVKEIVHVSTERPKLSLAIACLKDDALEEVVFHAAQTEIDTITFLRTDYSQEPKNSDLHKLVRRSELKSLVSLKQSKKPWLTRIAGPINFEDWLKSYEGDIILCDIDGKSSPVIQSPTTLLIGPEGGFSPKEQKMAKEYSRGRVSVLNLGNTRLRARTAAIIALGRVLFK